MSSPASDPIPRLSSTCDPPDIIGAAVLTGAAMGGAGTAALADMVDRLDADAAAWLFDMSLVFQLAFRAAEAGDIQAKALAASALFRVRSPAARRVSVRLLAVMAPGDLMANTPLDFMTSHLEVRLDLLFVVPGQSLPAVIPDHDIAFFAAAAVAADTQPRMQRLCAAWPRPVLNDPSGLPRLARDRLAASLAGVPGLCCPPTVAVERRALEGMLCDGAGLGDRLPGGGYPVLLRPVGSHAGAGLQKIDGPDDVREYLRGSAEPSHYVTGFMDYRSGDGCYRKYRVAFVDGRPYLCHMAVSAHWMVHYLNAGMTENADKRADEARAMAEFDHGFAARHGDAFAALHEVLPFDYYSIDCGETPDGRLLVFEADTAAIIHMMDPPDMFPYKPAQMQRVFAAFGDLLLRRLGVPAS